MVLAYFLIPPMGIVGAAIAGALGIAGPRTTRLIEVWVLMRMSPFGPEQTRVLLWGLPATVVLVGSRMALGRALGPVPLLLVGVSAFMVVYAVTVWLGAREEVERLVSMIRQRQAQRRPRPDAQPDPEPLDDDTAGSLPSIASGFGACSTMCTRL